MKVSLVINADTRNQNNNFGGSNLTGVVNEDFLIDGVLNKIRFFEGFDVEIILHIDRHNFIPIETLKKLQGLCDVLLVRKHTNEPSFNCYNYLRALQLATGDIVCHIDQDTTCFTSSKESVQELIDLTDKYAFVSYPSHWSPHPVHDDSFGGMFWASTRFFICKREKLKLYELRQCIENPYWMYDKYGESPRKVNWVEHYIAKINSNSVFYPTINNDKYLIWSWSSYRQGLLNELNNSTYEQVKEFINNHPIKYPNDVHC